MDRRKFIKLALLMSICLMLNDVSNIQSIYNLKRIWVTSAMTTKNHKYLAYLVASSGEVNYIMKSNYVDENYEELNSASYLNDETENRQKLRKLESRNIELEVSIQEIQGDGFIGHLMVVNDPSRIALATSQYLGKQGEKLTSILDREKAIAGINASGYMDENGNGRGGEPTGIIVKDGEVIFNDGEETHSMIGFDYYNRLVLGRFTVEQIKGRHYRDAVSFRPFLVYNGRPTKIYGDGGWGVGPRTIIGQREDGTVLFLVIDGRQLKSLGATMKQCQEIIIREGAINAANLDGGSSSSLVYQGNIVNSPSSKAGLRLIPSAFIVK